MSHKELLDQLADYCTGCFINRLIYIPSEIMAEGHPTSAMVDFQDLSTEKICSTLGLAYSQDMKERINQYISNDREEENLCHYLMYQHKLGFIAEAYFPEHYNFRVKEDGTRGASYFSRQRCHIQWLYGDSMKSIIEQMIAATEELITYDFEQEQANKITNHG